MRTFILTKAYTLQLGNSKEDDEKAKYLLDLVREYEQFNKYAVIGRFSSLEECENEAILFTKDKLKVVSELLSEDYKTGYKEGIEHYLASKNNL